MSRNKLHTIATSLIRDERGNEVIEYALLLGMIVCACIFFISALGKKVVGRWDRINEILDI
jgi:Flp pilus assembly pilin Flp